MDLITRSDDERLKYTDKFLVHLEQGDMDEVTFTYRDSLRAMISRAEAAENRQVDIALITAHRACIGAEHDPSKGKIHGDCVVCGVPWPCDYADPNKLREQNASLSRDLAEARGQLCRAREAANTWVPGWGVEDFQTAIAAALSSSSPCAHAEAKRPREVEMTPEQKAEFDALVDDTGVAMSLDGENASYHTKRLAAVLRSIKDERKELATLLLEASTGWPTPNKYSVAARAALRATKGGGSDGY